jgi:hypothetical protein
MRETKAKFVRVKLFASSDILSLEEQTNNWLGQNPDAIIHAIDQRAACTESTFRVSVLVTYSPPQAER